MILEAILLILLASGMYVISQWDGIRWQDTQSFMLICTGIQAITRFCLSNMREGNIGTTECMDLGSTPLKCNQVP
jgi:hypothetical protein